VLRHVTSTPVLIARSDDVQRVYEAKLVAGNMLNALTRDCVHLQAITKVTMFANDIEA
jgi:hypothetical protein